MPAEAADAPEAPGEAEAANAVDAIDETTRERPLRPARATAAAVAAAAIADDAIVERPERTAAVPAAEPEPTPAPPDATPIEEVAPVTAESTETPVDDAAPTPAEPTETPVDEAAPAPAGEELDATKVIPLGDIPAPREDDVTEVLSVDEVAPLGEAAATMVLPVDEVAATSEADSTSSSPAVETLDAAPTAEPEASVAANADQAVVVIPAPAKPASRRPAPRKKRTLRVARVAPPADAPRVLTMRGLVKRFGDNTAVDGISLDVRAGSFYGIVGPNGAGKTTTLSMVTGLLRPDAGTVHVNGIDVWQHPQTAKRMTGALPDRLRLFDRLTGAQLLYYSGVLRGLDDRTVRERSADLIGAFGLEDAIDRLVADYSAGMTKKIALACAMIHAPRLLVLDEPFESVDPVSAANLTDILERYVEGGGTVLLSSHGMDLIERVCDSAAIIIGGRVLAQGTLDEVRVGKTLEERFVELAGGRKAAEGMEWLHSFSD